MKTIVTFCVYAFPEWKLNILEKQFAVYLCVNLKKNSFSPRPKTYQTFSLVLLLLFLFQQSVVLFIVL